jgi:hypothetical protein
MAQAGATWDVIATEVGQIGLILGSDVLYPEVGRLLAYQGADMLIVQAACTDQLLYQKIRAGTLARMQDNQLFAAVSFLVGDNRLSRAQRTPFTGKSAIFGPQELTPRSNGVLVEMGNLRSEGVLAAQWDFAALRELWESSETPVRRQLPLQQAGQMLAQLYARLQALPKVATLEQLTVSGASGGGSTKRELLPTQSLDDLTVIATVTQRWPPLLETPEELLDVPVVEDEDDFLISRPGYTEQGNDAANSVLAASEGAHNEPLKYLPTEQRNGEQHSSEVRNGESDGERSEKGEDETDEMDAVAGTDKGR